MVKKRFFKKLTVLGLATAMLMGMTTNVTAIGKSVEKEEVLELVGYGTATCYLCCDYGNGKAEAETYVEADDLSYYVYSYTDLEIELLKGDGSTEPGGFQSNGIEAAIDRGFYVATSKVKLEESESYNVGLYAYSSHLAEIDEVSDSCYLMAEDDK